MSLLDFVPGRLYLTRNRRAAKCECKYKFSEGAWVFSCDGKLFFVLANGRAGGGANNNLDIIQEIKE